MFPAAYFPAAYYPPGYFPETGAGPAEGGGGYFPGGYFAPSYFAPSYFPQAPLPPASVIPPSVRQMMGKFTLPAQPLNYVFDQAFALWPRAEGVTLRKLASTPDGQALQDTVVSWAYRGILRDEEQSPTAGAYQGFGVVWRLPIDLLNGAVPQPADQVIDGNSIAYKLTKVHLANLTQEYRCESINLSVYLPDSITIERPTYVPNQYKQDVPSWNTVYALNARVQPQDSATVVENDVATQHQMFDVIVSQQITLQPNDRVNWHGNYYKIEDYVQALRITDFPVIKMRSSN